jgi:hypothetical protein
MKTVFVKFPKRIRGEAAQLMRQNARSHCQIVTGHVARHYVVNERGVGYLVREVQLAQLYGQAVVVDS